MGHYNIFLSPPMPILRAEEACDEVVDTNIILEGWECDTDTWKHHPEIPATDAKDRLPMV
jgi:hypothetical protein